MYISPIADSTALNIISLLAIGLGAALWCLDYRAATSRCLGWFLISIGLSVIANINVTFNNHLDLQMVAFLSALPMAAGFVLGPAWILSVRATIPSGDYKTGFGDGLLRIAQGLSVLYFCTAQLFPEMHRAFYAASLSGQVSQLSGPILWTIGGPIAASSLFAIAGFALTFRRKINIAERRRLIGFGAATPILILGVFAGRWAPYVMLAGEMVLIIGAIQFHILKAQKGDFMARFLPKQLVNVLDGQQAQLNLETGRQVITVVACDLRNFTPYAEAHGSSHIINLLRAYYEMVGRAASECGATIKDYAGDGVLMLVGAPIEYDDHAERGLRLSAMILERSKNFLQYWNSDVVQIGLGIGVATGEASVGVVGDERLEYAAVGPAINRAARLCDVARDGFALIGPDTYEGLSPDTQEQLKKGPKQKLKGMSEPVETWVLS